MSKVLLFKTAQRWGRMLTLTFLTIGAIPSVAYASVTCDIGSDLLETTQKLLGYQQGSETWDDVNIALGIIPSAVIGENIRNLASNAEKLSKLKELQELCSAIVSKDPVAQYFYVVDKLFSSTPMAPWVSMNVEVGQAIIANANKIVENTVDNAIKGDGFTALRFTVSLSQYRRFWINRDITGKELKSGNFLRLARVIVRNKKSGATQSVSINPGFDNASPTFIELTTGEFIVGQGNPNEVNLFFDLLWKNGQRSVVPIASNYYKVSQYNVTFPFALKNGNFILNR